MTDNVGAQIGATIKYLPFGEARATVTIPTDKLFTGQRLDATGLYYYNARYYDATIGRFISPDIVIQSPANPQCFNRYSYCINNPLKFLDPSGNVVECQDEQSQAAWDLFADTYPEVAKILIESDETITIQGGGDADSWATTSGLNIILNNASHDVGLEEWGGVLTHEVVHVMGNLSDEPHSGSLWEEMLACTFEAQFFGKIHYECNPGNPYFNAYTMCIYSSEYASLH
jgi:RHS repeat-associated protein